MNGYERGLKAHKEGTKGKYTQGIEEYCPRCEAELPRPSCKTCKRWSIVGKKDEVRYCERLGNEQEGLTCGCAIPNSGATIYTGPDFGCVHWEAK